MLLALGLTPCAGRDRPVSPTGGEDTKRNLKHVGYLFSLVKARRKLLTEVTDRCLNDMRCFRGGLTLGVHKIPFRVFSAYQMHNASALPSPRFEMLSSMLSPFASTSRM